MFGTGISDPIMQHIVLLFVFSTIQAAAFFASAEIAWVALWIGYVGVISVGRAWVNNEKMRTSIARKISDVDPDELPDLRISALLSALQLFILIPLLLRSSDSLFDLFDVPDDAGLGEWYLLGIDLLFKSLLDWSEIYGVQLSSIRLDAMGGRHLVMLLLLTIDFILIQGLLRIFEIRRTIVEGVSAAKRDPEMAYRLGRRAVPSLLEMLSKESISAPERIHIIEALAVLREKRACIPLISLFKDAELHATAVAATVAIGWTSPLIEALQNPSMEIRNGAVSALGRIGESDTIDALSASMISEDVDFRERVVRAISRIETGAKPHLMAALSDDSIAVRLAAIQGLTLDSSETLMNILIEMMDDSSPKIRLAVADALQRFSDGRVVPPLVAALDDMDDSVSRQAQRSLDHLESVVSSRGGSSDQ
ncbi:MAG: HEAT repeat domain-containing protein [Candidatus Thermoplasmatota archaeon]|nr:HEAT repeat domain-containing protein [Candidatus Thermoplasmatota archaeon]